MHDLRTIEIPKIVDANKFEYLCKDIWSNSKKFELVALNGSAGQTQDGVDIFGRIIDSNQWFGIQCKVRRERLTKKEIEAEISKASKFNPKLTKYIICTTLNRDVEIQKITRELNQELSKKNKFVLDILFWDDIEDFLKEEENYTIYHKYYKEFFENNETLGHAIGKLINLELGIGNDADAHYEILIGKIPKDKDNTSYNVNYYKGSYFIINFHERKIETFSVLCYPTDLEMCFSNRLDRFRITKWINSIKNLDDFIYQTEDTIHSYVSENEYKEYLEELREYD